MDLINGTRDDIYAFTHAMMYVAGFGLQAARLPRRRAVILEEADAALARCLDDQDYDLSGEVLLSWPLTGKSWSASAAFAFRVLTGVEDQATFLPTPGTRLDELRALDGVERTRYLLATAYHTAYVMGLLCAAALRPGYAPPTTVPSDHRVPGAAKQLMQRLDGDGRFSHWCAHFQQLTEPEADALAIFLLNVALRRRVVRRDFGGVREILELAYELNLARIPSAGQSAEMLDRCAAYARITASTGGSAPRSALDSSGLSADGFAARA
jgi:hypothetical protein